MKRTGYDDSMESLIALVTGASSGIGREAALALKAQGVTVYAGSRRPMPELARRGIHTLTLDVTDDESCQAAVAAVLAAEGGIDILVNNAGYGSYGSIEELPMSEARRQFDVNVFGAMRLAQLVLPHMTAERSGRIVNVSSIGGRFSMALGGWYHATKYAMEALSDALRQEVRGFGIDVVIIEPGLIHSEWAGIAAKNLKAASGLGKYSAIAQNFAAGLEFANRAMATNPEVVGRTIARAATTAHPRPRYRKGAGALAVTTLVPVVPTRLYDAMITFFLEHIDDILELLSGPDD